MHPTLELSEKIDILFNLREGEFEPEIHIPVAECIVDRLGIDNPRFWNLRDNFSYDFRNASFEPEYQQPGHYLVEHVSRLTGAAMGGLHPKLDISHWKDRPGSAAEKPTDRLWIAYEGKEVLLVRKCLIIPKIFSLAGRTLTYYSPKTEWVYRS
jgi:hypothetical protein